MTKIKALALPLFILLTLSACNAPTTPDSSPENTAEVSAEPTEALPARELTATPMNRILPCHAVFEPEDFIRDVSGEEPVTVLFSEDYDFNVPGEQPVSVILTDAFGQTLTVTAKVTLLPVETEVIVELGERRSITLGDFLPSGGAVFANLTTVLPNEFNTVRDYDVDLTMFGYPLECLVSVRDTTPPNATPAEVKLYLGNTASAGSFIQNAYDLSGVTSAFESVPDFSTEGTRNVNIILSDSQGNSTVVASSLTVARDTEPPVISGSTSRSIEIGTSAAYRQGVQVSDNADPSPTLTIDSSAVDLNTLGTYPVTYTASDKNGNSRSVTGYITVFEVTREYVDSIADEVLRGIITGGMTNRDKCRAIYKWIRSNILYTSSGGKESVTRGAYNGFRLKKGDCYTFYSTAEVLLTRAGLENQRITRVGGATNHYWNLVYIDDAWYHFDTNPGTDHADTCLFTDTRAKELTASRGREYYTYDETLYPEIIK